MPNKFIKLLQEQHLSFIKDNKKLLMVYIECKYFFNLSLNNRVVVIYFRYSGKEDHNWLYSFTASHVLPFKWSDYAHDVILEQEISQNM